MAGNVPVEMIQAIEPSLEGLPNDLADNNSGYRRSASTGDGLETAIRFAEKIHGDHKRPTGETYYSHGRTIAAGLAEIGIDDGETVIAAILHDALLPHTGITYASLSRKFGPETAALIRAANSLDEHVKMASRSKPPAELGLDAQNDRETLEAIRRALLSIIEGDIRIILIRMVDCLQDLRIAQRMSSDERRVIAYEALHVYAPIANRLGIWHLKSQLEDEAFRYLEPEKFDEIAQYLDEGREIRERNVEKAAAKLRALLGTKGIEATVSGRPKHIYSIFRKMQRKGVGFNQIYDIQALRVIVNPAAPTGPKYPSAKQRAEIDRSLCYEVLGAVHELWMPIRGEFDDYIGSPKANGYKSLHTAVIDPDSGQKLEVQIRSIRMHLEAENGIAAHWAYKEQNEHVSMSAQKRIQGLREMLAPLLISIKEKEEDPSVMGMIDVARLDERVHVFTKDSKIIDLPAGSTPIDFAYQIHTELGHRCRGARVNDKMVSLDYRLKSGDRVEIISGKRPDPSRDWMNPNMGYTGNARTRSKIRQWFRQQEREQNVSQGNQVVERELKRLGLQDTFDVEDIARALKHDDVEDFLCKVGFGDIQTQQIVGAIALLKNSLKAADEELIPLISPPPPKQKGLTVRGVSGVHTRLAGCCNPLAPEPIIGYITRGSGITIHRKDCKTVENIADKERLIEVDWGLEKETSPIPIVITAYRREGLIEDLINIFRGRNIEVSKTKLVTGDSTISVYLVVEMKDIEQLQLLLKKIDGIPNVILAQRQRWS